MFAFLYVKAYSKEICEEISCLFFRKILSAVLFRFKANYLLKCVATTIFFADSNSLCKDLLFLHRPSLAQRPLYLVGTVLNIYVDHFRNNL